MNLTPEKKGFKYWHLIVILLCVGWAAVWIYRTILTPIYPEIQAALNVASYAEIGLIASVYFFSYTGMQIPAGFLVDRFGSKAILVPGFGLFAIGALVIGSASSIMMVYAGSMLAGLGSGAYYGGAYSLSAKNIPTKNRTFANAIINSGSALGMAIGLIGSSALIKSVGMPWYIALYISAGIILVVALLFFLFIRNKRKAEEAAAAAALVTTSSSGQTANKAVSASTAKDESSKISMFSLRSVANYALYFATCYGYYMLVTWLPSFLEMERGFTGVAIGFSAALVAFASVPGALIFGRIVDRFRHRRIAFIVTLEFLAAATFIAIVLVPNAALLMVGLIVYGFVGKLAVDPMLISLVSERAPTEKVGRFLTTFNFFGMSSSVVAPFVTGLIADMFFTKVGGFYLACGLIVVCATFFLIVNIRSKAKEKAEQSAETL